MNIATGALIPEEIYPQQKSKFGFIAARDMKLSPVEWLIEDYIEEDALAVMYGPPGSGKSFIALDMAACISTGMPFHEHTVKKGVVFYIAGEGQNGIARRIKAWAKFNKTETPEHLFVSLIPAKLSDADGAFQVKEAIQQIVELTDLTPTLIIIDTLARNFGGDENSAVDIGDFIRNIDSLRHDWKATVLIVHHSGKDSGKGARGSSALKGAVDAEYEVSRNSADGIVSLTAKKMKDAEEPKPIAFKLVSMSLHDTTGQSLSSVALKLAEYKAISPIEAKLGKQQQAALDILQQMHDEKYNQAQQHDGEANSENLLLEGWKTKCADAGIDRKRFSDVKKTLLERGLIRIEGDYAFIVRPLSHPLGEPERTDTSEFVEIEQASTSAKFSLELLNEFK